MAHFTISAPPQRLREGDTVEFDLAGKVITYTVIRLHKDGNAGKIALKQEGTASNREVFAFLGMGTEDTVYDFAATAFGYTPDGGQWPWADVADFAAQVRLVWALYGALATYEAPEATPSPAPAGNDAAIISAVNGADWGCRANAVKTLVNALVGRNLFPR